MDTQFEPYAPPKPAQPPSSSSFVVPPPSVSAPSFPEAPPATQGLPKQLYPTQSSTGSTWLGNAPQWTTNGPYNVPAQALASSPHGAPPGDPEASFISPYDIPSQDPSSSSFVAAELALLPRSAYAPPPSQTAEDDPRTRARIPIFRFGFGGRVASCFHTQLDATTGVDVSLTGRKSSPIHMRTLKSLIPSSAIEPSTSEFPGPLFTGPSSLAIIKAAAGSTVKSKKVTVLKYLSERAEEVERGLGYISTSKLDERHSVQGLATLLRVLSVMVENDGKLSGT